MPIRRIYVSNASYPELRELPAARRRGLWWRTFFAALRVPRFWAFALTMLAIEGAIGVAGWLLPRWLDVHNTQVHRWHVGFVVLGGVLWMMLSLSWGGDIMRNIMRGSDARAGRSCPACGQDLTGLPVHEGRVGCPECGRHIPRSAIEPPNEVPPEYLAFSWRRNAAS